MCKTVQSYLNSSRIIGSQVTGDKPFNCLYLSSLLYQSGLMRPALETTVRERCMKRDSMSR